MHTTGVRALGLSSLLFAVALQTGCAMTARATREDIAHQLAGTTSTTSRSPRSGSRPASC